MIYTDSYESPLGSILLAGDEEGLTGLWFREGSRYVGTIRDFCRGYILSDPRSGIGSGRYCVRFRSGRR